jgi:hypothetical protein
MVEPALLPIEVITENSKSIIDTNVYQYPAVGTTLAFPENGKFVKYEVVDVIQMVSPDMPHFENQVPPRVMVVVRFDRALNI